MKKNLLLLLVIFGTLSLAANIQKLVPDSSDVIKQIVPKDLISSEDSAKKQASSKQEDIAIEVPNDTLVIVEKEAKKIPKKSPPTAKNQLPNISDIISPSKIIWALIFILISYFIIRLLVAILERFAEKSTTYRLTLKSLSPFIRIIGWILVIIVVVEGIFQPPFETIIAVMASVGIAIGFAAQDILKNIFGGIMILFDRPFQVGDKIEVGNYYGEVKEIGLRSTRIVTKDDSLVSVPNAEVVNKAVSNANSGETNCQVVAEIFLPIDIDTNLVRQISIEAAQISRYIYLNKPITVLFFNEVKDKRSYLKMRLKAYVSDIRYEFAFQSDMTEIVMKELLKQGILDKKELL